MRPYNPILHRISSFVGLHCGVLGIHALACALVRVLISTSLTGEPWWAIATDVGRLRAWLTMTSPSVEEGPRWPSRVTGWHALVRLRALRWLFVAPTLLFHVEDVMSHRLLRRRLLVADGTSRRRSLLHAHTSVYIVVHRSARENSSALLAATIQLVFRSLTIRSNTTKPLLAGQTSSPIIVITTGYIRG